MAKSAEKGQDDLVGEEVDDNEFELMFGKASEEGAVSFALSQPDDTKTPEELEAEKKAAKEAEGKTPEELEAEKKAAEEKTPEELEAEKKTTEAADALKVEQDAATKVQQDADAATAAATAKEVKEKADAEAEKVTADRDKRATLSKDEKAVEAEMAKDFPDVKKVMDIQYRIMQAENEKRMVEFQDNLIKELGPTIKTVQAVATDSFERAVYGKHPDTQELLPEVETWVAKQPTFLRAAYNKVLDKGTATETIELMDTFKSATGRTEEAKLAADKVATADAAAEKKATEDAAREKKLASQEGIRGRQDTKKDEAPSSFEEAFNKQSSREVK